MPGGIAVNRHWIFVLKDGRIVIDWGEHCFQDLIGGEFFSDIDQAGSHTILDDELAWLKRSSSIDGFDNQNVYITGLPQRPLTTLD